MGRFFKIVAITLALILMGSGGIGIATVFLPEFREKVELVLNIKDENSIYYLKNKINSYQSRVDELKKDIADLNARIDILKTSDIELNEKIKALQSRVDVLEKQVSSLETTIESLNKQIADLDSQVDSMWSIFDNFDKYDDYVNNGGEKPDLELTEDEKDMLEAKIESLENQVKDLTNEVSDLNNTIDKLNNQIEDLKNQKSQAEDKKEENIIVINQNNENIVNITNNIVVLQGDIDNYNTNIENNNKIIKELEQKEKDGTITEGERANLSITQNENKELIEKRDKISEELTELENQVSELTKEVETLEANNKEYTRQIESLDEQITTLEKEVVEIESESTKTQANINSLQDKINKFNGLISNSTIKNDSGDVVEKPTEPSEPTTPTEPSEPTNPDLEYESIGESIFNLSLEKMQSYDDAKEYLPDTGYIYSIDEVGEDYDQNFKEIFKGVTAFVMGSHNEESESPVFGVILYESEELAKNIFSSVEEFVKANGYNAEIKYIARCGVVGYFELEFAEELEIKIDGESHYEFPYEKLQTIEDVKNYLSEKEYVYNVLSIEDENIKEYISSEMLDEFKGALYFVSGSEGATSNTLFSIVIYDTQENASRIFESSNVLLSTVDGNAKVNCVAHCGVLGLIEIYSEVQESCDHKAYNEERQNCEKTDFYESYDLVKICKDCGEEISRESIFKLVNDITLNTFNIGDTEYSYIEGETFKDWLNSTNNNSGFYTDGDKVYANETFCLYTSEGNQVQANDKISSDIRYTLGLANEGEVTDSGFVEINISGTPVYEISYEKMQDYDSIKEYLNDAGYSYEKHDIGEFKAEAQAYLKNAEVILNVTGVEGTEAILILFKSNEDTEVLPDFVKYFASLGANITCYGTAGRLAVIESQKA